MSAISTHPERASPSASAGRAQSRLLILILVISQVSYALADRAQTPSLPATRPVPIEAYAEDNPSCLEWTNGCTICTKAETGAPACSTPGIACQPAGIQCKKKAP